MPTITLHRFVKIKMTMPCPECRMWFPGWGPDKAFVIKVDLPAIDSLRKAIKEQTKQ